jgi:hypothetical protein
MVSMPVARILTTQGGSKIAGASVFARLMSGFGWNLPTIGIVGAAIAIPVIAAQDDDDDDVPASP